MRTLPHNYNGFEGAERRQGSIAQDRERQRRGPWFVRACLMCGLTYDDDGACVIGHLEDYARPIEAVLPVCVECHERLHRRFWQPNTWIDYLVKLRDGYRPPAWRNILQFRAANTGADLAVAPAFEPDPAKWWEVLSLRPIDYRRDELPRIEIPSPLLPAEAPRRPTRQGRRPPFKSSQLTIAFVREPPPGIPPFEVVKA
ncbi:MAG: hypothetical protein EKK55_05200 [Rhodocyclaceae bacterium]|nr:MAG: hypothetical protein EKK55_05200 [Rhodocyclaceae bacterium]